jgi:hypothetical protein
VLLGRLVQEEQPDQPGRWVLLDRRVLQDLWDLSDYLAPLDLLDLMVLWVLQDLWDLSDYLAPLALLVRQDLPGLPDPQDRPAQPDQPGRLAQPVRPDLMALLDYVIMLKSATAPARKINTS